MIEGRSKSAGAGQRSKSSQNKQIQSKLEVVVDGLRKRNVPDWLSGREDH